MMQQHITAAKIPQHSNPELSKPPTLPTKASAQLVENCINKELVSSVKQLTDPAEREVMLPLFATARGPEGTSEKAKYNPL